MDGSERQADPVVTLSEAAAQQVKRIIDENNAEEVALRVFLKEEQGQAVHGLALEPDVREDDNVLEQHGVTVVVDPLSAPLLQGSYLDFQEGPGGTGFTVSNPNLERRA